MPRYAGLDLTGSTRPSGYAVLDAAGVLLDVSLVGGDAEIVAVVERSGARTVAIDCPLGLPTGLDCLDPAHACAPSSPRGIRESELAVGAMGFGLYYTTKRTIIRPMVERGIVLRRTLVSRGVDVMEVYPYATKCVLFGTKMPKKTTAEGVRWLRDRLEPLVPRLDAIARDLAHDELDAVVAAYTALLYARGAAIALGNEAEGTIVMPDPAAAVSWPAA
jgi:predicted nuclease with RNAse H fold